jgi:peptidoglycan L-alanyl-D-glutamate endopeptidase CwlK
MTWKFSRRSYDRMAGVRPELIAVATRALLLSPVDFGISEGMRSAARQAELVRSGASQTHRSRHLTGHAIDVVAYVGGEMRWDWPLYDAIAKAMASMRPRRIRRGKVRTCRLWQRRRRGFNEAPANSPGKGCSVWQDSISA